MLQIRLWAPSYEVQGLVAAKSQDFNFLVGTHFNTHMLLLHTFHTDQLSFTVWNVYYIHI